MTSSMQHEPIVRIKPDTSSTTIAGDLIQCHEGKKGR